MKKILTLLLLMTFVACNDGEDKDTFTHHSARAAAERYYTDLIEGRCNKFVEGMSHSERFSETYRSQLQDMVGQMLLEQRERNGGLHSVSALRDSLSEADSSAYVQLEIHFADSTSEQVALPLVMEHQRWKMK